MASVTKPMLLDETGLLLDRHLAAVASEHVKQTALLGKIAGTTARAALFEDWSEVAAAIAEDMGPYILPVGTQVMIDLQDSRPGNDTVYHAAWNAVHHGVGALADGETIPVAFMQMDKCLPFDTMFSAQQAFLTAVDPIPAGTYYITMGFSWGSNVVNGKTYQFTLTQALPAGGQLAGFRAAPDQAPANWKVYAYASATEATPTETCDVTEGANGTSLGTFTTEGVAVPESGTPEVTTNGSLRYYGLNSLHRVAYGNNRWLHSALRQFLNASGSGWWHPATVFDRPPSYVGYDGYLTGLPEEFVAAMRPVAQVTALNYITDGGTSAAPLVDTTYDRVFLPSWGQHWLSPTSGYGGAAGLEGEPWEYWERVAGTTTPLPGSTWGNESTYHPEFVQYDVAYPTTPRNVWMRSAYRGGGASVAFVTASGNCYYGNAFSGFRAAPACAIG